MIKKFKLFTESVENEVIVKLTEPEYVEYKSIGFNDIIIPDEITATICDLYDIEDPHEYSGYSEIWFDITANNDDRMVIFIDDDYWLYVEYIFTSDYDPESVYYKIDISNDIFDVLLKYHDIIDDEYRAYMHRSENKL